MRKICETSKAMELKLIIYFLMCVLNVYLYLSKCIKGGVVYKLVYNVIKVQYVSSNNQSSPDDTNVIINIFISTMSRGIQPNNSEEEHFKASSCYTHFLLLSRK